MCLPVNPVFPKLVDICVGLIGKKGREVKGENGGCKFFEPFVFSCDCLLPPRWEGGCRLSDLFPFVPSLVDLLKGLDVDVGFSNGLL